MRIAIPVLLAGLLFNPVPALSDVQTASQAASSAESAKLARLRAEQQRLLREIRKELAKLKASETTSTSQEHRDRRQQLEQLVVEIERRIALEDDPRTTFVEPRRASDPFTQYYDRLMTRIEQAASGHFPTRNGKAIYGQGRLRVIVRANGTLEGLEIAKSSGDSDLDGHIIDLVRRLEPLEAFGAEMNRRADRVVIETQFRFFNDSK